MHHQPNIFIRPSKLGLAATMTRFLIIFGVIQVFAQQAGAHSCILQGDSAAQITVYNNCKSDLMMGLSGHDGGTKDTAGSTADTADAINRIKMLEDENKVLRGRLELIKRQLLDMLGNI
jgi:hypothetical protein